MDKSSKILIIVISIVMLYFGYSYRENYLADYAKYKYCACRNTMEDSF